MTAFNKKTKTNKTINHEGAVAYKLDAKLELYSLVVTSLVSDKFYETSDDRLKRLQNLLKLVEPEFVAKLAVYAREQMYLRSMPLILVTELAKIHNGDDLVRNTVSRVVQRVDEITELLAYYALANGRKELKKLNKLSTGIRKGLSDAFNKFNEYQFAKYDRDGEIKLRDALFIVHPKAETPEQQVIFDKIANKTLETPYTWETQLSERGNSKEVWEELISSGKVGYMALLRNLRNILDADVGIDSIKSVVETIGSAEQVRKSKQFPFRFLSAYREIQNNSNKYAPLVMDALEDAILTSVENLEGFDYDTSLLIASDVSGSMDIPVSPRSKIRNYDIGLVLSMLLKAKSKNVVTGIFGTDWKRKNLPTKGILANTMTMGSYSGEVGWSTNGYLVLLDLLRTGEQIDKVMMFTDCELWDSYIGSNASFGKLWNDYKKISPNSKLYLFDLSGYGTTPVSTNAEGVYFIAGWSDKVFTMLEAVDNGSTAVKFIEDIVL